MSVINQNTNDRFTCFADDTGILLKNECIKNLYKIAEENVHLGLKIGFIIID